jgi:hypothetical protein
VNADTLHNQIEGMKMIKEAEQLAKIMAEREIARHKMRTHVRTMLSDKVLSEALRAQAWIEADPSKVTAYNDGRFEIAAEGWPLGSGSPESEVMARLQRRLFPDEADREAHAWVFEESEDG